MGEFDVSDGQDSRQAVSSWGSGDLLADPAGLKRWDHSKRAERPEAHESMVLSHILAAKDYRWAQ